MLPHSDLKATFVSTNFYSGDASAAAAVGVALLDIGNLTLQADVNVDGKVYYNLPSMLWVAPTKVIGGNVGFGAIVLLAGRISVSISMSWRP